MSTEIYYFSGTGNSLHVARELQSRLPEAALIPILSLASQGRVTARADTVGFVFPHYASTLPKLVRTFVEELDLDSADHVFAVATRGATRTMADAELDQVLSEKGHKLDAFFVFTMPSGSAPLVKAYASQITAGRIERLEKDMLARLDTISALILNRETSREEDTGATPPPTFLKPLTPLLKATTPLLITLGKRAETSFGFYADESCTGCGICEGVCLAGKIQMVGDAPVWQDSAKCLGCFACLNFCPEESIQAKSKWYLKSFTTENGRYHHPDVTADDIAGQKPEQAWTAAEVQP